MIEWLDEWGDTLDPQISDFDRAEFMAGKHAHIHAMASRIIRETEKVPNEG